MDPNPNSFPVLSYVMSRLPNRVPKQPNPNLTTFDIEQPNPSQLSDQTSDHIFDHMPHLNRPEIIRSMTLAVSDVAQSRSILQTLGPRPDHELLDNAKLRLSEIEITLSKSLESIVLSPRPEETDRAAWRQHLAERESLCRSEAEVEKRKYKAVVELDEMHEAYESLLRDAENRLMRIYSKESCRPVGTDVCPDGPNSEETNEEVVDILRMGEGVERVVITGKQLRILPEAFGKLHGLVSLHLGSNQLEIIPDSIAGLKNLEELNISSNLLKSLPDSIGLLRKLMILDVSGNKLNALPDSICYCSSLVELDVSFNGLTYLPTNIGHEFTNLTKLLIQLNKLRSLPTSICEMKSLRHLDAHFNELHGIPAAIGRLTNLEILNLSSNFNDLTELPVTIGELTNLRELDLSNNQIHALPDTFGKLENLTELNLDQNPLVTPPKEVISEGVEAVKVYMSKRWLDRLLEEEERSMLEMKEETQQTGWLSRSTSWLTNAVSGVSGTVSHYLGSPRSAVNDPYLEEQR